MRVIGPNCLGIMNTDPEVSLNAAMAGLMPPRGSVSISSHSGALGIALLDYVKSNNLGIAHFASIGNRIDISSNDLLEFWEDDDNTRVILLTSKPSATPGDSAVLPEGLRARTDYRGQGRKKRRRRKGRDLPYRGTRRFRYRCGRAFQAGGRHQGKYIEEMFNVAKNLAHQPLPKGPRLAILTNAGGPGVLAVDAAISYGLSVPPLSEETGQKLAEFLPKEASLANPVDMIASATGEQFGKPLP